MRWLARVFASAVARRLAALLVAAVLAWIGIGSARANGGTFADQGAAYAVCKADSAAVKARTDSNGAHNWQVFIDCTSNLSNRSYRCEATYKNGAATACATYLSRPPGEAADPTYRWPANKECSSRPASNNNPPDYVGWATSGSVNGTLSCNNGCVATTAGSEGGAIVTSFAANAVCDGRISPEQCAAMGSGYYYNAAMGTCVPRTQECTSDQRSENGKCIDTCPSGMTLQQDGTCANEKNECPAGQIKSPAGNCLPGDGQCAQGEALGKDGTCKKDSDGDGEADEDADDPEQKSFSGGDNCDSPPSCAGDPIMCGQARIQWRIDCNTRRNVNISGGQCNAIPICTGKDCKAMEYSQLLMQWRTACALEKLNTSGTGGSGDDANVAAIKDALTGNAGSPDIGEEGSASDSWADGEGGDGDPIELDDSGYGWGGASCPAPPTIDVMGTSITFDVTPLCRWLDLGSYFVLALAALASLRIAGSKEG